MEKKRSYVNHYSFHIYDPIFGHVTIKMSGHPPFPAQVILNGHEYVAALARSAGIAYRKEGNCFTGVPDPAGLAGLADTLSSKEAIGRLGQVCDRWIYSACLCFGLDLEEQARAAFATATPSTSSSTAGTCCSPRSRDGKSLRADRRPQPNPPRRKDGAHPFRLRPAPAPETDGDLSPRQAVVIETPSYDLTVFKVHFGLITLKAYSKGEHVLRFEAVVHNTRQLHLGRVLERFPEIVARLHGMLDRFTTMLDCVDIAFLPDGILEELPRPSHLGATRVGGIDLNKPRVRAVLAALVALAPAPRFHRRRAHRQGPRADR